MSELKKRIDMIGATVGRTPLVELPDAQLDLRAKLEFTNPNGSMKDRSAYWILRKAIERGEITERTTVVESSSGNFATALAAFCRSLGLPFVPVIDPHCNALPEAFLHSCCDRVEKVTHRGPGGYLEERLARVAELCEEVDDVYWTNQYANPDAADAHYQLTGSELSASLSGIDYLFVGVGTGGTIAGLSRYVKELSPDVTVVAVDAAGSVIFGGPPGPRRIPGLGSSIVPPLTGKALIDDVVIVTERETAEGCRALFADHGLYAGGSTGSVYAAIGKYFAAHPPPPGHRPTTLFLCADRGVPYTRTLYDPAWVARNLDHQPTEDRKEPSCPTEPRPRCLR